MKKLLFILPFLLLGACASTDNPLLVQRQLVVVDVPPEIYEGCPIKKNYPNWKTLTDPQVAKTVVELHKNNRNCYDTIQAIKAYQEDAKAKLGQGG